MNNIKTADDVRNWARMIVDAKGDKYIPLAKADMLAIAQYIVDGEEHRQQDCTPDPPPQTAVGVADTKPKSEVGEQPTEPSSDCTSTTGGKTSTTATMTRSYALHRAGFTVQQAYDKFLEWCNDHPKEASVMDFRTGVKSSNAAFAYWLSEIITAEVPTTVTACI